MSKLKGFVSKYRKAPEGAKAAIWYTFANLMQKGINVLVVPIYTRLLTTAEYGTYTVFVSWMELFEIIVTFRLFYGAYVVGLVKFEKDRESYTSSLECLSIIITTGFLALYLIFHNWVDAVTDLNELMTLLMFAMIYAVPLIGFWKAWERVDNRYLGVVLLTLAMSLFTPIFGIAGILCSENKANAVIYSRVGIEIAIALFLLFAYHKRFLEKIKLDYWKYALKMNVPLIPYYLSMIVLNHSDRIIIQKLVGYSEAGIYSVAYSVAMVMTLFSSAFNSSVQPWLFKELENKNYKNIPKILDITLLMIAGLNVLLIAAAPEIISVMAPQQYHEAIYIIPPLAASVFVMACYQNFVNVEFYYNESRITAIASIGAAVLNIILNFMLIPKFGYLAAGYTTLVSYIAFWVAHYFFVKVVCNKNKCPISVFDLRFMGKIIAGFSIVTVALTASYTNALLRYAIVLLIFALSIVKRKKLMPFLRKMLGSK